MSPDVKRFVFSVGAILVGAFLVRKLGIDKEA